MNNPTSVEEVPFWENWKRETGGLESKLCHRQMLRAIPVADYSCDVEGRVAFHNLAAAELWVGEPELNKDLWCGLRKIFKSDGTPMPLEQCPIARTICEGHPTQSEQTVVEHPKVSRRVHPYFEPFRNFYGTMVGAVNALADLAESKQP